MNRYIALTSLERTGNTLRFSFDSTLDFFHQRSFYVQYDSDIDDHESIHAIIFAALMTPVSWATGADLFIPSIDAEFADCLDRCKSYWEKCFPKWSFKHQLVAKRIRNQTRPGTQAGILFSAGLDSLSTYIRHQEESPKAFVILGADIPEQNDAFIKTCRDKIFDDFARAENIDLQYISTDAKKIFDRKKLKKFAPDWYAGVQFSLLLTSLTAPLCYQRVHKLVLSSCSHRTDYAHPCAGDPEVTRHIRWAGTQVQDDGNEYRRVEKVSRYLKENPRLIKYLRVCWKQQEKINCGECEKCCRTMCELLVHNLDPTQANFDMDETTLPRLRRRMETKFNLFFRNDTAVLDYWREIQTDIDFSRLDDIHGSRAFFSWLFRFERLKKHSPKMIAWTSLIMEKIAHKDELGSFLKRFFAAPKVSSASNVGV